MNLPSAVPLVLQNPCCWSINCSSYQSFQRFMIIMTIILQKLEPFCSPIYVLGSSAFPLLGPFHKATSFECPQYFGIIFVDQTVWYSFKSSIAKWLQSRICHLLIFRFSIFRITFLSSAISVGPVLMPSVLISCNLRITSGISSNSGGADSFSFYLKCSLKNAFNFWESHFLDDFTVSKLELSDLKER